MEGTPRNMDVLSCVPFLVLSNSHTHHPYIERPRGPHAFELDPFDPNTHGRDFDPPLSPPRSPSCGSAPPQSCAKRFTAWRRESSRTRHLELDARSGFRINLPTPPKQFNLAQFVFVDGILGLAYRGIAAIQFKIITPKPTMIRIVFVFLWGPLYSRGHFPIPGIRIFSENHQNSGNSWFLERMMVGKNGESTPRIQPSHL